MERNNIHHLKAINDIRGLELIELESEVSKQFELGSDGMEEDSQHLLRRNKNELLNSPVEAIRSWLCEIYIARGQFDRARLESLRDRGVINHNIPSLTLIEIRKYLNWRNVTLQKREMSNYNYFDNVSANTLPSDVGIERNF